MKVAFLGLGIMGLPMAENLAKAGNEVRAWNRSAGKTVKGANVVSSPREAATGADVVWICVSDTAAVQQVLFGPAGVAEALRPGMVVVDSSTISPAESLRFAERVRAKGADFVEAPVTGSKIGAQNGQLIFIVGGRAQTVEKLKPLFDAMGKSTVLVGDNGKGLAAKLAMNLMIALIYEGFAEALTLSGKLGVDHAKLLELINQSMVRSGVVEYKAPFVLNRDFTANFPLRLMHKDIRLMLEAGKESGVQLPGLAKVAEIYEQASKAGLDDLDYASTLTLIEKWAGMETAAAKKA